jgi:hypothetical protein
MVNNLDLNAASLSHEQAGIRATGQQLPSEMGLDDEMNTPSMWGGLSETEQGNEMMASWEGREETHNMFIQSYD